MQVPVDEQDQLAAQFEEYLGTVAKRPEFLALAASREDKETVVCISGFKDLESLESNARVSILSSPSKFDTSDNLDDVKSSEYQKLSTSISQLVHQQSSYNGKLRIAGPKTK